MIGFYGFNPSQNPLYANLLGQSNQYQNPLFSRLGGDNSFSRLQTTYSNVFNPEIIQAGLNAYNQGMKQFTPFDQAKYDADIKAQQEAAARAAQANQSQTSNLSGLYRSKDGRVGTVRELYSYFMNQDSNRAQFRPRISGMELANAKPDEMDKYARILGFTPLGGK